MAFSGAVKLADLDDFMAPAQDCIKPLIDEAKEKKKAKDALASGSKEKEEKEKEKRGIIKLDLAEQGIGHFDQIKTTKTETAKITLDDCLACSG